MTAPRAELKAVLWVAEGAAAAVQVVTNCKYVYVGAAALSDASRGALAGALLKGPNGELWRHVAAGFPRARWTPVHLGAPVGRVTPVDWQGGYRKPDATRLPPAVRERCSVHDVVACVEIASGGGAGGGVTRGRVGAGRGTPGPDSLSASWMGAG